MPPHSFNKPRLPTNYYVWSEPPDSSGDEVLHFVSERRRVKLKGHSFREFERRVISLLDGRHTMEEIESSVRDVFDPEDLRAGLELLASQNLIEESGGEGEVSDVALAPQLNYFHELGLDSAEVQRRLRDSTVTVVGLGGAGAMVAQSLAAARVGTLRCADTLPVSPADIYLSSVYTPADLGAPRVAAVASRIRAASPQVKVSTINEAPATDDDYFSLARGSDLLVCCVDAGQSSIAYKLNRACLKSGTRWTSCALSGTEVVVGPTVHPFETACYLCYKMRSVACAGNPEDGFAFEQMLDRRKQDDSGRRENLVFGAGLAANLLGLEALKELAGVGPVSTRGKIAVFDLLDFSCSRHVVLRKPWCPACFQAARDETTAAQAGVA